MEQLPRGVGFLDESLRIRILRDYQDKRVAEGLDTDTVFNRMLALRILCKQRGIKFPLDWGEMPAVEEVEAVPYTDDELEKIFAAMDDEQRARCKFFLGTACRDKEVTYAAWQDIDFSKNHLARRLHISAGYS